MSWNDGLLNRHSDLLPCGGPVTARASPATQPVGLLIHGMDHALGRSRVHTTYTGTIGVEPSTVPCLAWVHAWLDGEANEFIK